MGQKAAAAFAASTHLAKLERLTLNEPRWKPETTALFAGSPTLANAKIYLGGRLVARRKPEPSGQPEASPKASPAPGPPRRAASKRRSTR